MAKIHYSGICRIFVVASAFWLSLTPVFAQSLDKKCKNLERTAKPALLDSLSVLPSSISIASPGPVEYIYELSTGLISFPGNNGPDSVNVCYQPLPVSFHHAMYNRSLAEYDSNAYFKDVPVRREMSQGLFKDDRISKAGSIVRDVSAGNNQDMIVNSTMDISLEGSLNDHLNIQAEISDQNIPYQAEGNTQYVQDIDRVFIRLYNQHLSLTAGDVSLKNPNEGFLKFNKRVQGALFQTDYRIGETAKGSAVAALSAAKGKFASVGIEVQEGVTGPYKIYGPEHERLLFIVANTEKVYLDGKPLERGYDRDYIIDYNQSEVTFTARVLLTRYSRVRIDFEYADRNYSRAIAVAAHRMEFQNFGFFVNFYQEKDNPARPLSLDMTDEIKNLLMEAGDDMDLALTRATDSVGYHENEILYKKVFDGEREIFRFSTQPDSAVYRVRFTEVGPGKGSYRRQKLAGNGWIYEYVEPLNGEPQGDYEAAVAAPAPSGKRMITAGGFFRLNSHEEAFAEAGFSKNDLNLLSPFDSHDDSGAAWKIGLRSGRKAGDYDLQSQITLESLGRYFSVIDRYREVEYERKWIEPAVEEATGEKDLSLTINTALGNGPDNYLRYSGLGRRYSGAGGFHHTLQGAKSLGRSYIKSGLFHASSENGSMASKWTNIDLDASYRGGTFIPGYAYRLEKNALTGQGDSIAGSAGYFRESRFYIKNSDSLDTRVTMHYSIRNDREPVNGIFVERLQSRSAGLQLQTPSGKRNVVNAVVAYHKTRWLSEPSEAGNEEFISGSLNYSGKFFGGILTPELDYALSNGRELKREYIYMKTPVGQGFYTWIDVNGDEVQDLNEFFEANYEDERNYVRIYAPTSEYIVAFGSDFRFRLKYEAPERWRSKGGILKFLSAFSGFSTINAQKKAADKDLWSRLSPFSGEEGLSFRYSRRHQVFFNRSHPVFGVEMDFLDNSRRQLLTSGYEENGADDIRLTARINPVPYLALRGHFEKGVSYNESDFLSNRNFIIDKRSAGPEVEWLPARNVRLTGRVSVSKKLSQEGEREGTANFRSADLAVTGSAKGKTFSAGFRYVNIDYRKPAGSFLEYEMLEALRQGKNISWRLQVRQDLASYLSLDLNYQGRKSQDVRPVHFGRVQMTAYF